MTKPNFLLGIECEGKYKGLKTLFVVGDKSLTSIFEVLDENDDIKQIYFGAYHQSKIKNWNTVYNIKKALVRDGVVVTAEILLKDLPKIPKSILEDEEIHKIFTTHLKEKNFKNISLKVENEMGIFCFHDYIFNDYSPYDTDTIIF